MRKHFPTTRLPLGKGHPNVNPLFYVPLVVTFFPYSSCGIGVKSLEPEANPHSGADPDVAALYSDVQTRRRRGTKTEFVINPTKGKNSVCV